MESPDQLLDKFKRNEILKAIRAAQIDPREFDLKDSGSEVCIKHKWSASHFTIRGGLVKYTALRVVGDAAPWAQSEAYSWQGLMELVSTWLFFVKVDLDTPDLWAELQREAELLGGGSAELIENTPFTSDEQQEIARRLEEVATDVKRAHALSKAQAQTLDEKLDYLVRASARLGRIDWRNAFVGAILGYVLSAALAPESALDIALTLLRAIGTLFPELPSTPY
jgi:hypothetical protein